MLAGLSIENREQVSTGPPTKNQEQVLARLLMSNQEQELARMLTVNQEQVSAGLLTENQDHRLGGLPKENQEQRSVSLLTRDHTGLKASLWCWAAEYLGHDVSGSHALFWRAFKKVVRQLTRQSAGG